ncbi:MAG: dockerin type I domain-containing protein [Phycisphaerales bacterium]|nr:dockerin type I domain-containing protein [Phycisphaerales bacterium]
MNVLVELRQPKRQVPAGCIAAILLILGPGAARATAGGDGFQLFDDHNGYVPATFTHAVGPDHIVAATYQLLRYYTKEGALEFETPFGAFFAGFPTTVGLYEPKVIFDTYDQRFMLTGGDYAGYLGFAVSDDDNPHGDWIKHYFHVSTLIGPQYLAAPPKDMIIGVDDEAVYLTWDNFGGNEDDTSWMIILNRAQLLAGQNPIANVVLTRNIPVAFAAALNYDAKAPAQYLATTYGEPIGTSRLTIKAIRNPLAPGTPLINNVVLDLPPFTYAPFTIPQAGTSVQINSGDSRVHRAVYRDGSLWIVHHCKPAGDSRVLARWYELHMNGWPVSGSQPEIAQYGHIDPGPGIYTWLPDIAVDSDGNVAFAYARSAADELPSVCRAFRRAGDPPGTLTGYAVVKDSEIAPFSGGHQWALYSSIGADPAATGEFIGGGTYRIPTAFGGYTLGMWVAPFSAALPGDLNGDGAVNVLDLLALIGAWGACPSGCAADLNADNTVNVLDLLLLISSWG